MLTWASPCARYRARQEPAAPSGEGPNEAAEHVDSPGVSDMPSGVARKKHPLSGSWGQFFFTYSPAGEHAAAQWQAKCPYHRLNAKTDCTQSLAIARGTQDAIDQAKLMLMNWCVQGATCTRKREHAALRARALDCEPLGVVTAKREALPAPPPRHTLKTDAQLDAEETQPDPGREELDGDQQGRKRKGRPAKVAPTARRRRVSAQAQSLEPAASASQPPPPSSTSSSTASSERSGSSELDDAAPLLSLVGAARKPEPPAQGGSAPSSSSSSSPSGSSRSASTADEEGSDSD